MKFVNTKNSSEVVNFEEAVTKCFPVDGGFYVPCDFDDLRRWILYTNEKTSFSSIAGTLTSAFINDEFSPIICETIASEAFPFQPVLKRIDDRLFVLELFNTPTGTHKDFGISFLVNFLETIHKYKDGKTVFLDATTGELGAAVTNALRTKKHLKAVLVCPKGFFRGIKEEDLLWNGGNILPVEVEADESECQKIVRDARTLLCGKLEGKTGEFNVTSAGSENIGRLLAQSFFYPFAFSRLKKDVFGDIFYAMSCGNYSNLVAAFYAWKYSMPVNGFICPTAKELFLDGTGRCVISGADKNECESGKISNLERLKNVLSQSPLMAQSFIFPADVNEKSVKFAAEELFSRYGILSDKNTAEAYSASLMREDILEQDEGSLVLIMRDHPSFDSEFIKTVTGKIPETPENIIEAQKKFTAGRFSVRSGSELVNILKNEF